MYKIRTAKESDLARISELENTIFSDPWSEENLKTAVLEGRVTVAIAEGKSGAENTSGEIAGYLIIYGDDLEIDISVLAVDEKYRRQGIGKLLMDSVTERCPAAMLWLEVREGNTVARNFYEKYGFVKSHIRKNYYENPTDNAIIMSRPDFKSLFTKNP